MCTQEAGPGAGKPFITDLGGIAIGLINKTGALSVKGTIVEASTILDNAVGIEETGGKEPIAVIYNSGVPDGELVFVVISGRAEVLVEDNHTVIRGNWLGTSDSQAGRVDSSLEPPATSKHDQEVGHATTGTLAGIDQTVIAVIHFR